MRQPVDRARLRAFMRAFGREADRDGRAYLTGGARGVLLGWRKSTIDIDLKLEPESDRLLRAVAELKERLGVNLELASPDLFSPELTDWRERSAWIA
ncbi:MAG TPA: hypothetical protein VFT98_16365, partial [Myxococcota bacterium]|nr:hypothetical protein [Myxococcota bacterium]